MLAFDERDLTVRLTNGTNKVVRVAQEPYVVRGGCKVSFTQLLPGEVGTIKVSSKYRTRVKAAALTQRVHHSAVIELIVGEERLIIAELCPLGQSRGGRNRFHFSFSSDGNKPLASFLHELPKEFMGSNDGSSNSARGKDHMARTIRSPSVRDVDLVLLSDDVGAIESWDSLTKLRFAELCREHQPQSLVQMLFVIDALGAINSLEHAMLNDRAYAFDLLVTAFVQSGLLALGADGLRRNLARWEEARRKTPIGNRPDVEYFAYNSINAEHEAEEGERPDEIERLEELVEASSLLVRAVLFQCFASLHRTAEHFRDEGLWSDAFDETDRGSESDESHCSSSSSSGDLFGLGSSRQSSQQEEALAEHLTSSRDVRSTVRSEDGDSGSCSDTLSGDEQASNFSHMCTYLFTCSSQKKREHIQHGQTTTDLLIHLVHKCMVTSAGSVKRRSALYEFVATSLLPSAGGKALLEFSKVLPVAQRVLRVRGKDFPESECKTFSTDALANLDDGLIAGPEEILRSFGDQTPKCKTMSTNSKSGEFFFMSGDSKFLVKTISDEESVLMRKMLPHIQHHIRKWPQSLIVRFVGLFHIDVPTRELSRYFVVMRSVFDPERDIKEIFDLKGSLHNRRKKDGERVGKDEDWLGLEQLMKLTDKDSRELLAMHELDAELLQKHEVMDYSLLVGVHHIPEKDRAMIQRSAGFWKPSCGILSADCSTVYYAGLIDFLIGFDLRKEAEHLIRIVQGVGASASCVSPEDYAKRQARFLRDRVVADCGGVGQMGRLKIEIHSARSLFAGDWGVSSDPYVAVTLGLLTARTATVRRDLNPTWNCTLSLPVNGAHFDRDIVLSVWDEDMEAVAGSDDFLGEVAVPVTKVLGDKAVELHDVPLTKIGKGTLSAKISFEAAVVYVTC